MKAKLSITGMVLFILYSTCLNAQSFRKGTLLVGISEGSTMARYTTSDVYTYQVINDAIIKGDRDPLQIEYGISKRWGLSLSCGNDIFKINPQQFYHYSSNTVMKSKTSENLIEINYHFFITNNWDIALFYGLGCYKVELFNEYSKCLSNALLTYEKGGIVRYGVKARYYFTNRWAILGMFSAFNANAHFSTPTANDVFQNRVRTDVKGLTLEFGISYKIIK